MMKKKTNILMALLFALALAACSSDEEATMQEVTLTIPIEIYSSNAEVTSRAASQGDPGNDVVFEQPLYLYVYACVKEKDAFGNEDYELLTKTIVPASAGEDNSQDEWTLEEKDTKSELWKKNVDVTFKINKELAGDVGDSRVFAIASRDDLSGKLPADYDDSTPKSTVEAMTLDLSGFTSEQLKNIYSTPLNDTNNGVITSSTNGSVVTLTCSTVRLYHVAAKVDFTWEVASALQPSTELATITCTGLPTTCNVFEPTDNPSGNGTSLVLGTTGAANTVNEANKWLGRAYAFMLQPPTDGKINYTVTFGGSASRPAVTTSITPATLNDTYTGWYRVIATVE